MTKFEKDAIEIKNGDYREVFIRRRNELKEIEREGKRCKNSFRTKCLAQEFVRLKSEFEQLEKLAEQYN